MTLDMFRIYSFFYPFGLVNIPYIAPHVGIVYYSLLIALKKTNEMSMTIDLENTEGAIKYGQSRETGNTGHAGRRPKQKKQKQKKQHNTT